MFDQLKGMYDWDFPLDLDDPMYDSNESGCDLTDCLRLKFEERFNVFLMSEKRLEKEESHENRRWNRM